MIIELSKVREARRLVVEKELLDRAASLAILETTLRQLNMNNLAALNDVKALIKKTIKSI
jgi:hypothetical protein